MSNKPSEKSVSKKSWSGKTKIYFLTLVAGIGLIAGGLYYKNDSPALTEDEGDVLEIVTDEKKDEVAKDYFEGTLSNSDDPARGNYKLASEDSEIYLRTGRDFSKLVGLQVMVFINGTMEKFELVDIQSKVAGDSYLLPR